MTIFTRMIITNFNINDSVICSDYGMGIVTKISSLSIFPIHVHFEDQDELDYVSYTADGRSIIGGEITLTKTNG